MANFFSNPRVNALHVGLAFLKLILRVMPEYKLSFRELEYGIEDIPRKAMFVWEGDCSGILKFIDWNKVREFIAKFEPKRIHELMLWGVDEEAAIKVVEKGISYDDMKRYALRVLDYIQGVIRLKLRGYGVITVPRPSRDLKLLSLDVEKVSIGNTTYYIITLFDGDNFKSFRLRLEESHEGRVTISPRKGLIELVGELGYALDEGFTILVYTLSELRALAESTSDILFNSIIQYIIQQQKYVDVHDLVKHVLGIDIAPLEELEEYLQVEAPMLARPRLQDLREAYNRALVEGRALNDFLKKAEEYGRANAYSTYILYLALTRARR